MMRMCPHVFLFLAAGFVSLAAAVPLHADEGGTLRKLEARQGGEAARLDKVAGEVDSLLEDLASNGLLEQGGGEKVANFREVLENVASTRLPAAAGHLRSARLEKDATHGHIASADDEVEAIVKELGQVLAGSSALLAEEALVQELKEMIRVQTDLRAKTAEWGKAMLIDPETADAGKGAIMQEQSAMLPRFRQFIEKLVKTRDEAVDEAAIARLRQAESVLNPAPPQSENKALNPLLIAEPTTGDVLQAAVTQLEAADVLAVVAAQDRAIESFKQALQILSAGQSGLADLVAGLEKLIGKQKLLRNETEAEAALEARKSFYEARQVEIQNEVTDFSFEAPDLFVNKEGDYLIEPLMISLGDSVAALNAAAKEQALPAQDRVIDLLQAVYGSAAEALEEEEGDPFWAESPEVPEEAWKLPKDGEEEDEALADEDFPEIFEGITAAELMIQPDNVAQGAQADVTTAFAANRFLSLEEKEDEEPPDFITDEGPPSVGKKKAPDAPGGKGRGDASAVDKDRLAKEAIQRTRPRAKVQDYVSQLPPEFRSQVADYYESIAE